MSRFEADIALLRASYGQDRLQTVRAAVRREQAEARNADTADLAARRLRAFLIAMTSPLSAPVGRR